MKTKKNNGNTFVNTVIGIAWVLLLVFTSCNKEEMPTQEEVAATQLKGKAVDDSSETIPVTITGDKDFGRDIKGITVLANGKEVEVIHVEGKEITVAIPIKYEGEVKVEVFQNNDLVFQTVLESLNMTWVSTFAGNDYGHEDGPIATAKFTYPVAIDMDASGNIYVADAESFLIRKVDANGMASTFPRNDTWDTGGEGPPWGPWTYMHGIAVDGKDNVYLAHASVSFDYDADNERIVHFSGIDKMTPDGSWSTVAGGAPGFADGPGKTAKFREVRDVEVDVQGNLYVADEYKIRKITFSTSTLPSGVEVFTSNVSTIAGSTQGFTDGPAASAKFNSLTDLALDGQGNIYVADHNLFRKVDPNGNVSTLATLTAFISGIAIDDVSGNIYCSVYEDKIIKFTPNGTVSTVAGSTNGFEDGYWALAKFYSPSDVVLGPQGNIYVADNFNSRIRKITLDD